ncbi:hypothetical protein [Caulobacter sp. UC70_42]|uniref:hypothetical protein n=1 Tax=Caulobacter sp. UC70_42 TaxID=3374551 RepID=UPI003757569A
MASSRSRSVSTGSIEFDGQLQVVDAAAQQGDGVQVGGAIALEGPQSGDQGRAQAVVHVLHQPLAFLVQQLAVLDLAQPLVAGGQLGFALGQASRQIGLGAGGRLQRLDIAAEHDVPEQHREPDAGEVADEHALDADDVLLQRQVVDAREHGDEAPDRQQQSVARPEPDRLAHAVEGHDQPEDQEVGVDRRREQGGVQKAGQGGDRPEPAVEQRHARQQRLAPAVQLGDEQVQHHDHPVGRDHGDPAEPGVGNDERMHADEGVQHPQEDHDGSHEVEQVDRLAAAAEPDEQGEDARRQERERRERRQLDLQNLSNGVARRQLTIIADPDRRERPADAAHMLQSDVQRPGRMRDLGARQADQQRLVGAVPLQIGVRLMD